MRLLGQNSDFPWVWEGSPPLVAGQPARALEVCEPPIPHQLCGGHAHHEALAWSQAEGVFHTSPHAHLGMPVGMEYALCL